MKPDWHLSCIVNNFDSTWIVDDLGYLIEGFSLSNQEWHWRLDRFTGLESPVLKKKRFESLLIETDHSRKSPRCIATQVCLISQRISVYIYLDPYRWKTIVLRRAAPISRYFGVFCQARVTTMSEVSPKDVSTPSHKKISEDPSRFHFSTNSKKKVSKIENFGNKMIEKA